MSKNLKITIFLSSMLLGLLLIPLDGRVDNTFVFFVGRFHPILLHLPIGGLIALIEDGDLITIDAKLNEINLNVSNSELLIRRKKWIKPVSKVKSGILNKYLNSVSSASEGCVTDL